MKSLAELQAIKDRMKDKVVLREGTSKVRVVVGMATCGIAAGARPVLNAFVEGVSAAGLSDTVSVCGIIVGDVIKLGLLILKEMIRY